MNVEVNTMISGFPNIMQFMKFYLMYFFRSNLNMHVNNNNNNNNNNIG